MSKPGALGESPLEHRVGFGMTVQATIHLQGLGQHPAIPVRDLTVGTVLVWNAGHLSVVTAVERVSPCYHAVTTQPVEFTRDGYVVSSEIYRRRFKGDRLVAVSAEVTDALAQE